MKYIIEGGKKLIGKVKISGNKNSVFPCMAAAVLTNKEVRLQNIPGISDTGVMVEIFKKMCIDVDCADSSLKVKADNARTDLPPDLVAKLRGSIVLVGAILGRFGRVSFTFPGGDIIGRRSIDTHLQAFIDLGVKVSEKNNEFNLVKDKMPSSVAIFLDEASVTATENMILYCVLSDSNVTLSNCASEPHVVDLCQMLISMGSKIEGIGTDTLKINGVDKLNGTSFRIRDDHIEIGTYAVAAALTGGEVEIQCEKDVNLEPILFNLEKFGIIFKETKKGLMVSARDLRSVPKIVTNLWPGFPTDLMSAVIVLATQTKGATLCHDWMYESRMFFVDKLIAMGAKITIADPHRVMVYGPAALTGRVMDSPDIRAGMALVLAALASKGESVILNAQLIERGYEDVTGKLKGLGAKIEKSAD